LCCTAQLRTSLGRICETWRRLYIWNRLSRRFFWHSCAIRIDQRYSLGQIVSGPVTNVAPFGAFVVEFDEFPYLLAFLFSALVTNWLGAARRTAEEGQKAHLDELFEQTPEALDVVMGLQILIVDGGVRDRRFVENHVEAHIFEVRRPVQPRSIGRHKVAPKTLEIPEIARAKIVHHHDSSIRIGFLQSQGQIRPDEPGSAGH